VIPLGSAVTAGHFTYFMIHLHQFCMCPNRTQGVKNFRITTLCHMYVNNVQCWTIHALTSCDSIVVTNKFVAISMGVDCASIRCNLAVSRYGLVLSEKERVTTHQPMITEIILRTTAQRWGAVMPSDLDLSITPMRKREE
jgi:hypothetical protein